MEPYIIQQCIYIVKTYYENGRSLIESERRGIDNDSFEILSRAIFAAIFSIVRTSFMKNPVYQIIKVV